MLLMLMMMMTKNNNKKDCDSGTEGSKRDPCHAVNSLDGTMPSLHV
jgi:hypothetical protein